MQEARGEKPGVPRVSVAKRRTRGMEVLFRDVAISQHATRSGREEFPASDRMFPEGAPQGRKLAGAARVAAARSGNREEGLRF